MLSRKTSGPAVGDARVTAADAAPRRVDEHHVALGDADRGESVRYAERPAGRQARGGVSGRGLRRESDRPGLTAALGNPDERLAP